MLLLWILVLVVGIAYLAHRRTAPLPALGVVAVYLLAMGVWSHAPGWLLLVFWVLLAAVAAPLLLPDLRRQYFTKPLLAGFIDGLLLARRKRRPQRTTAPVADTFPGYDDEELALARISRQPSTATITLPTLKPTLAPLPLVAADSSSDQMPTPAASR